MWTTFKICNHFQLVRVLKSCEPNSNLQISHSTCISSGFGFFYIYFCDIIFIFGRNYSWGLGLPQQYFEFYYYLKIKLVRFIVKMPCWSTANHYRHYNLFRTESLIVTSNITIVQYILPDLQCRKNDLSYLA